MHKQWLQFTFIVSFMSAGVFSARILGIFPTPSISHQVVFRVLMEELAKRGHHVVTMTTDPVKYIEPEYANLTQIDVHDVSYSMWRKDLKEILGPNQHIEILDLFVLSHQSLQKLVKVQLGTPEMQKIIHDPNEHFDVCFIESIIPVMAAFSQRFNCPLILFSSFFGSLNEFDSFGSPSHPIIYNDIISSCYGNCNLLEKSKEVYNAIYFRYMYKWKIFPGYEKIAVEYFGPSFQTVEHLMNHADLLLLNAHPILVGVRPVSPGIIYVEKLHLKPCKPLPKNIQSILDNAKNGVIYFSLGSNVKSTSLPTSMRNSFLQAFKELPYTIIWKWEDDTLSDKPPNVFISKWWPQKDIFNHSNILAFITQGGLQSLDEAIHHRIPLVVMPFYGDQAYNKDIILKQEIGVALDKTNVNKDHVRNAIKEVIENPKYKNNIIKLSKILDDQPQTSLERAVWWTEYVIRNKGAKHLRSPSADIPLYAYFLLDVAAFIIACFTAFGICLYIFVKILLRKIISCDKLKKS